jgi:hypothetical protein
MDFRDIMDTSESWSLLQTTSFQVWIAAMEEERLAYLFPVLKIHAPFFLSHPFLSLATQFHDPSPYLTSRERWDPILPYGSINQYSLFGKPPD